MVCFQMCLYKFDWPRCLLGASRAKNRKKHFHSFFYWTNWLIDDHHIISYKLFLILVISLSVLCLVPCPVFVWGPPGILATVSCWWVMSGLRSLNAAFHCWSCVWRGYEACISQTRRQKTNLKSRQFTLRVIQQYSSEEYWNHPRK
jgi:hypothetical protein